MPIDQYDQPTPPSASPATPYRDKTAAVLLAFFAGYIGIHKFYLGQTGWGIAYIVFSWSGIPWIAGIIEGIILSNISMPEFQRRYNPTAK